MNPLKKIKAAFIRRDINRALEPIDTEEERNQMADEQVKKGVPPWLATVGAAAVGFLVAAVQDVANGGNFADLVANPKKLVTALVAAILIRVAHGLTPPAKTDDLK